MNKAEKPEFEKEAKEVLRQWERGGEFAHDAGLEFYIAKALETAYNNGRKAQMEVDARIAECLADTPTINKALVIAEAIRKQEV